MRRRGCCWRCISYQETPYKLCNSDLIQYLHAVRIKDIFAKAVPLLHQDEGFDSPRSTSVAVSAAVRIAISARCTATRACACRIAASLVATIRINFANLALFCAAVVHRAAISFAGLHLPKWRGPEDIQTIKHFNPRPQSSNPWRISLSLPPPQKRLRCSDR